MDPPLSSRTDLLLVSSMVLDDPLPYGIWDIKKPLFATSLQSSTISIIGPIFSTVRVGSEGSRHTSRSEDNLVTDHRCTMDTC